MAEKAPLRPASTRLDYQTFRCDCSHRRRTPAGPTLSRKSPPSPACRSSISLHTCRVTARLLSGRTGNDDTRHGLVPERSDQPRSPHSCQTLTPHSTSRPHQSEHPHGTYDDTRAGHDAFSRGLVEDYDHGNHHLARATIRVADPDLVTCAGLSALDVPDTDATIIDELARASDPNPIASVLADAALLDLDRYATGRGLRYSRVGTALMLAAPNEQRLADAIDTVAASSKTRPVTAHAQATPLPRSAIFCAPRTRRLTSRQKERLREAFTADEAHVSVEVAYLHRASARGLPPSHTRPRPTPGRSSHPAPTSLSHPRNRSPRGEPYASGRTHSTTTSTPAEQATAPRKPSTDIIELGRRTARGYRNPTNYRLRMLLIAGGLDASTHTQL